MGWKQSINDWRFGVDEQLSARRRDLRILDKQQACFNNDLRDVEARLTALEAKASEKCCGPVTPQPGDRVKLRDVPVGRWVLRGTPIRCLGSSDGYGYPVYVEEPSGRGNPLPGDTEVTLLPEDYSPEGKPEGSVGDTWRRVWGTINGRYQYRNGPHAVNFTHNATQSGEAPHYMSSAILGKYLSQSCDIVWRLA